MMTLNKKYRLPLTIIVFALIAAGIVFATRVKNLDPNGANNTEENQQTENTTPQNAAINGLLVNEQAADARPIAVMIENHPDSRPQSGLSDADIVYETLAEGGITRFVALYQSQEAKSIGPVRSARDYFAAIADEYGALYAHVGGSDEVLEQLSQNFYKNITDINEYFNGSYFERIKTRAAPHNTYTSLEKLRQYLADKKARDTARLTLWDYTDEDQNPPIRDAATISIDFSMPSFKAGYSYDNESKRYKRLLAGSPHIDATTKQQITAKTIIVQFVPIEAIPGDEKLRIDIDLFGEGKALVFQNGTTQASWIKSGPGRTLFLNAQGNPISFNRGQMWVELVPNDNPAARVIWKAAPSAQ
jgi:hypothetical protein